MTPAASGYQAAFTAGHSVCRDRRIPLGRAGEAAAARHLRRRSYAIIEANYRTRYGEIDIIARRGDVLAFVEVKTRQGSNFGRPFEAVGARKQEQLRRMALAWLARRRHDRALAACTFRFDVVSIVMDEGGAVTEIDHMEDAFR